MNTRTLQKLEFDKIIHKLSDHATSAPGRELCQTLLPSTDLEQIKEALLETSDALSRILRAGNLGFSGLKDIRMSVKSLEVGSTLSIKELLEINALLHVTSSAARYGKKNQDIGQTDSLDIRFNGLMPLEDLSSQIDRCIISEEEIADDASSELKNIRRLIRNTNDRIRNELSSMLTGSDRNYLQEAVITSRGGRYCVPVKAEYRSQVAGMVHDQSKGGSTFFIEPMSVVRLNNELRELDIRETDEIARILATLSALAGSYSAEILGNYEQLRELDFIFAKAKLSLTYKGSEAIMNTQGVFEIRKGRHPLIDSKKVVPVDIKMGGSYRQLIITGPNTGGKTVTLKTIGLFSLMAQAGLHIPALDRSQVAIFQNIYADIGDEQSIEQSLSTFSSHMKNIVTILQEANGDSLVLFDELCAGTDPTEGAALAMSILTNLGRRNVTTVATTHYSELKVYALSTEGVENACCEFDLATLAPTYRLLIGIPGKSNAFAISGKLGLPQYIIQEAEASIGVQDKAFEEVIADLENSRKTIEQEQLEIQRYKTEIENLKSQLQVKHQRLDERSDSILGKAREEAAELLREAKEVADEAIRAMNKAQAQGMTVAEMEAERRRLKEHLDKVDTKKQIKAARAGKVHGPKDFHIGDQVQVLSLNLKGTVHSLPNQKGDLTVTMGILHSTVNVRDLEIIEEASAQDRIKNTGSGIGKLKMSKTSTISPEINLIGMTKEEALMVLDKYLDDAYLSHLSSVRVVHGKGSGVLRNAVAQYLRSQKHVKSHRPGTFGEGDYGVTIVEFKQ